MQREGLLARATAAQAQQRATHGRCQQEVNAWLTRICSGTRRASAAPRTAEDSSNLRSLASDIRLKQAMIESETLIVVAITSAALPRRSAASVGPRCRW